MVKQKSDLSKMKPGLEPKNVMGLIWFFSSMEMIYIE